MALAERQAAMRARQKEPQRAKRPGAPAKPIRPQRTLVCPECQKSCETTSSRKYCGEVCSAVVAKRQGRSWKQARKPPTYVPRTVTCAECQKPFYTIYPDQK